MITLFKRKDPEELSNYHTPDFETKEWDAFPPVEQELNCPAAALVGGDDTEDAVTGQCDAPAFQPLAPEAFRSGLEEAGTKRRKDGVLTYDLICAPPKNFSIAALATPELNPELLRIHHRAVEVVAGLLGHLIGVPKMAKKISRWIPSQTRLWRFRHAFNTELQPQLHDHLCLFNYCLGPLGCLDGTPLFDHQKDLDAVYNYALVSGLGAAGFVVDRHSERSWDWSLAGVPQELVEAWSSTEIKEELSPAERRYSALGIRKKKEKLEGVSLVWARRQWSKRMEGLVLCPKQVAPPMKEWLDAVPVEGLFRRSGVLSRVQILAEFLSRHMGSTVPPLVRARYLDLALESACNQGTLEHFEGRVFSYPPAIEAMRAISDAMDDGRGKGQRVVVRLKDDAGDWPGLHEVNTNADRPDAFKIAELASERTFLKTAGGDKRLVSADDLDAPVDVIMGFGLSVVEIADQIVDELPKLLVISKGEHYGPFWKRLLKRRSTTMQTLVTKKPLLVDGHKVTFYRGEIGSNNKALIGLLSRKNRAGWDCVVAPKAMPVDALKKLWRRVMRLCSKGATGENDLEVDRELPWPTAGSRSGYAYKLLTFIRPNSLIKSGKGWVVQHADEYYATLARSLRTRHEISWSEMDRYSSDLQFVAEDTLSLPRGLPCVATRNIRVGRLRIPYGMLLTPVRFDLKTRSIVCEGDIVIPRGYRFLSQALVMQDIPVHRVDRLVVQANSLDELRTVLRQAQPGTHIVVISESAEGLRRELAQELLPRINRVRSKEWEGEEKKSDTSFFPPEEHWAERLRRQRELNPPPPQKKELRKPAEVTPEPVPRKVQEKTAHQRRAAVESPEPEV